MKATCNYYELWIRDDFGEETGDEQEDTEYTKQLFEMQFRKSTNWYMDEYRMDTQGDNHDNWNISMIYKHGRAGESDSPPPETSDSE